MWSKVVSTTDQTPRLCPNFNQSSKTPISDSVSFASQVTRSRISVRSPIGPRAARGPARISSFYAPFAETAETLYQVLGIPEGGSAGGSEIKRAYKQMARMYHPDVSPPGLADEYARRFIMVRHAYEILSNPQTRASYDGYLGGTKSRQCYQEMEENVYWKSKWESQLDELARRGGNAMSWGAQVRSRSQT